MPGYKGHIAGGIVVWSVLLAALHSFNPSWPTIIEWLACCVSGALFPDIDIKSKGQKLFYWLMFGLFIVLIFYNKIQLLIFLSIIAFTPMLVRHRGIFHRLWFIVGFPTIVGVALSMWMPTCSTIIFFDILFFVAGAVSHLWLDMGFKRMLRW